MDAFLSEHRIGCHTAKQKSLCATVRSQVLLTDRPYQIFLGNPQSSHVSISDAELTATVEAVTERGAKIYVHTPYIINLSATNDWNRPLLQKNLEYSVKAGFKGVVVHVGKSTSQTIAAATQAMRENILAALPYATTACPLLLETPAGQGTELLKGQTEFIDFVKSFADDRIRVCMDTCHVFACGHDPLTYLQALQETPGLLKLVHFNDSQECCGSCKDRHAFVGTGHIGFDTMRAIAAAATAAAIPMVIE